VGCLACELVSIDVVVSILQVEDTRQGIDR